MTKYHISPATGRPNICRATIQCPIGDSTEHYNSKAEAQAGFEHKMTSETVPSAVSKKKPAEPAGDPEVNEARDVILQYGDIDSFTENPESAAKRFAEKWEMKEEKLLEAINQIVKEEEEEHNARLAHFDNKARDIAKNTSTDLSKVKKGSIVAVKMNTTDVLRIVKISSHRNGKIYGNGTDGNESFYIDGWDESKILTSDSDPK